MSVSKDVGGGGFASTELSGSVYAMLYCYGTGEGVSGAGLLSSYVKYCAVVYSCSAGS